MQNLFELSKISAKAKKDLAVPLMGHRTRNAYTKSNFLSEL